MSTDKSVLDLEKDLDVCIAHFRLTYRALTEQIQRVIVGHDRAIEQILYCLLSGRHALLEGVPGLGKTLLVRTLSKILNIQFARIQFTPDLMPADIMGTDIVVENEHGQRKFEFQKGPLFANIILADEINRATPKTQSALLEAMEEGRVTVARGTYDLPNPLFVLATQNPLEMEGTYPLPEAQLDRFMLKVTVDIPDLEDMDEILTRTTGQQTCEVDSIADAEDILRMKEVARAVPIPSHVRQYVARLVLATHADTEYAPDIAKQYIRYGASPRAAQAIVLASKVRALAQGRHNVSFEDVKSVCIPALRHRIILTFEGEAQGVNVDHMLEQILCEVGETTAE